MRAKALVALIGWSSIAASQALAADVFDAKTASAMPADWKTVGDGTWTLDGGKLKGAAKGESTLLLGDKSLRDVVIDVELAFAPSNEKSRWFGIVAREAGEPAPGVQFTMRQDSTQRNGVEIAAKDFQPTPGWHVLRVAAAKPDLKDGKTHRVRFEAVGNWLRGYIDDTMVIRSYRGAEFDRAGAVALRLNGATVMIDKISISPVSAADAQANGVIRSRPFVVAHRGFSFIAPENTLASYKLAIEAGADMAECDVYLTKDNVLVLMHDRTIERTTGNKGRLRDLTLEEVRKLDAGKWKAPQYAGEGIPTLVETLNLVKGKLRLVIEIKEETIAADVVKAIKSTDVLPQDVMIFSFYDKAVEEIAKIEPLLPTTWLLDDPGVGMAEWRKAVDRALEIRASAIGTSLNHVDPGFVRLAHECGLNVFVWTVNDPRDVAYLVRIGVDAIISDRPDMALGVVRAGSKDLELKE